MLIKLGLINGHLKNGIVETTKFGLLMQSSNFSIAISAFIKWFILLFYPEDAQIVHVLGDFSHFFGPKIVIDTMIILDSIHCLIISSLFCYCSMKPKKLLFWLELMEFDVDKKCFAKPKFNKSDSQLFTKVFAISITLVWRFTHFMCLFNFFAAVIPAYLYQKEYFFYYLISIICFTFQLHFIFGQAFMVICLLMVIFQVS